MRRASFTALSAGQSERHTCHAETRQQDLRGDDHAMSALTRRAFLSRIGAAGALAGAAPWLPVGYAQTVVGPARAFLRRMPGRAEFDRRVFGSFLEHLGRAIYTG